MHPSPPMPGTLSPAVPSTSRFITLFLLLVIASTQRLHFPCQTRTAGKFHACSHAGPKWRDATVSDSSGSGLKALASAALAEFFCTAAFLFLGTGDTGALCMYSSHLQIIFSYLLLLLLTACDVATVPYRPGWSPWDSIPGISSWAMMMISSFILQLQKQRQQQLQSGSKWQTVAREPCIHTNKTLTCTCVLWMQVL